MKIGALDRERISREVLEERLDDGEDEHRSDHVGNVEGDEATDGIDGFGEVGGEGEEIDGKEYESEVQEGNVVKSFSEVVGALRRLREVHQMEETREVPSSSSSR